MAKKEMNFKNQESLEHVQRVIDEASEALKDKSRKIQDSPIQEALVGALGAGTGAGIGFAGLYFGGSVVGLSAAGITSGLAAAGGLVGGGMVAGIGVLAAPAVILGGVGVGIASHVKSKKLQQTKELLYKEALKKQNSIIDELAKVSKEDKERIELLNGLNRMLTAAIKDLKEDLNR